MARGTSPRSLSKYSSPGLPGCVSVAGWRPAPAPKSLLISFLSIFVPETCMCWQTVRRLGWSNCSSELIFSHSLFLANLKGWTWQTFSCNEKQSQDAYALYCGAALFKPSHSSSPSSDKQLVHSLEAVAVTAAGEAVRWPSRDRPAGLLAGIRRSMAGEDAKLRLSFGA